jgi:mono/diheme cytochrome c family protein
MTNVNQTQATPGRRWLRRLLKIALVLILIAVPLGILGWYKLLRELPQPEWITSDDEKNFMYGSIGSEGKSGIPYWIFVVLPRIFPEYLPGPGGYASLGLPWEEGKELPSGFSKKTVGFERVAFNCALCHTSQYRMTEQDRPVILGAGTSQTADIQAMIEFLTRSAADPRFNADTILKEIDLSYKLSGIDRLLYRYLLIPMAKKQLMQIGQDYDWVNRRPRWGPGRDAPFNLTKFALLRAPEDNTVDNTDFPAIWHLSVREQPGRIWPDKDYDPWTADFSKVQPDQSRLMMMSLAGDTTSFRSVAIDAALGLGATNTPFFNERMQTLVDYLRRAPPPKYPLPPTEAEKAAAVKGEALFEQHCANCHAGGRDNRMGTVIPTEEVGTDAERTNTWTREAADGINKKVIYDHAIIRSPMSKPPKPGYTAMHMDGLWLRGPYLHNGAVPTLRALLEPAACRPRTFYRGYDLIDREHVGFVSLRCGEPPAAPLPGCSPVPVQSGCMPPNKGWKLDTSERGNGNGGHEFGTKLSDAEKSALVAYLRTQ